MPRFRWTAVDGLGKERSGTLEAGSTSEAATELKRQGYAPMSVIPAIPAAHSESPGERWRREEQERVADQEQQRSQIICPHCQTRGHVHTRQTLVKRGVSGGKAAAAVLTGGVSVLFTGLSQKVAATSAKCDNCGSEWQF